MARIDEQVPVRVEEYLRRTNGEPPEDGPGVFYAFLVLCAGPWVLYWLGVWLVNVIPYAYREKSPLSIGLAIASTLSLAAGCYFLRERKRIWFLYPPMELAFSMALASLAVTKQTDPVASIVALIAAVRVAIDGINRLIKFWEEAHTERPTPFPATPN